MNERVRLTLDDSVLSGVRCCGVSRFRGLRYALPPTGERRFAPPAPCVLEGEIDATRPGPVAPQAGSLLARALGEISAPQAEDCLHLSVWTPDSGGPLDATRPVLVWLHGGGLQSGGAALDWYDGASLARAGGVVVVGVNYRLGALGWLSLPGGLANLGLLDQELALKWVAKHIGAFGGDPRRITVMGQSAGGMCAVALLARRPMFRRVVLQSAPLGRGFRTRAAAASLGDAMLRAAGASDLAEARALPLDTWLQAPKSPTVREALDHLHDDRGLFSLVADGTTLPTAIDLDTLAGQADVLIGTNRHEMAAFPGQTLDPEGESLGDAVFSTPASRWAGAALAAGRQAWRYRFDVVPNKRFGACHCIELPFVFGTHRAFAAAPMLQGLRDGDVQALTQAVQHAWLAFVRDGVPPWPGWPHVHLFTEAPSPALQSTYFHAQIPSNDTP